MKSVTRYFRNAVAASMQGTVNYKKERFFVVTEGELLSGKLSEENNFNIWKMEYDAESDNDEEKLKIKNVIIALKTLATEFRDGGKMEDNGPWLDNFHKIHPNICLGVSEYGCEGIITYHGPNPACKDYSEEYQALYHEHMAKVLDERPWIWSSHVWNMFDFGCAARDEGGVAGRNNKGLVTMDRKIKKDSYYIYKAYWNKEPMVHLCGKRYAQRAGETTEIRVYSNQPSVTLFLNGEKVEELTADKVFVFTVALKDGFNIITAQAGDLKDTMTLEKVEKEPAIYVLPEVNERAEGVANWFSTVGDMDLKAPMEFPEGMYSIKDTLEELAKCPEAIELAAKAVKLTMNMVVSPGEGMWDMMKGMTLERLGEMAGTLAPEGFVESLNGQLIKIKKV